MRVCLTCVAKSAPGTTFDPEDIIDDAEATKGVKCESPGHEEPERL